MIQFELYNVSKVVDDGNFSKKLENRVPLKLTVEQDIPCCARIALTGMVPPLQIAVKCLDRKKPALRAFYSYTEVEPNENKHDKAEVNPSRILIVGEKGPKSNQKIFRHPYLYLNFVSMTGANIQVTAMFSQTNKKKKKNPMSTIDSKNEKETEDKGLSQKPIATQLVEFEKGVQKLSEVQAMVTEARNNRQLQ